jgi:hypothetical protein
MGVRSFGMLRRVAFVRTDISAEHTAFTILMIETYSSETSVLPRTTRRNVPEDGILHSHRCENFKSR